MSEISAGVPINEPTAPAVIPEENKYLAFKTNYSQTLLLGHRLNTNASLLWRVCFVPGERRLFTFNTDTFYGPPVLVLVWFDCMSNILVDHYL